LSINVLCKPAAKAPIEEKATPQAETKAKEDKKEDKEKAE